MRIKVGDIVHIRARNCTPPDVWMLVTETHGAQDAELHGRALLPFLNWQNRPRQPGDRVIFNSASVVTVDNDNPTALAAIAKLGLEGKL